MAAVVRSLHPRARGGVAAPAASAVGGEADDQRALDGLRLQTIDDELAAVWPRPRRRSTGVSPDVERIAALLSTGHYAPLAIDADDLVVDPDGETKIEAARLLGWEAIRVRVEPSVVDPVVMLADKLTREHYPTSRIIAIVTSPVFWRRFTPIIEAARGRMLHGSKASEAKGMSRDVVASSIGLMGKGRALQTMLRARKILGDDFVDEIARGESSLTMDNIERTVRASGGLPTPEQRLSGVAFDRSASSSLANSPWRSIFSDNWQCRPNSGPYGSADFRGGAPNELIAHLIARYTAEGDLVVDPLAGSGRTIDIATQLKRRVVAADQLSRRGDILTHRIERGPIPSVGRGKADLVIVDPPYHDMMSQHYGEGSSSNLPWDRFCDWLRQLAKSTLAMTRKGGYAGTLVMNVRAPGGQRRLLRREFEGAMAMVGWTLVDELVASTAQWPHAAMIQRARLEQVLLSQSIYVGIWRR